MQHLKDPAAGVAQVLLPHIHLVSKSRYPVTNNPTLESIVSYLSEAPKVVRDLQPMQWQFLDAPTDGTLLLVWQPLEYMGTTFASDGYIYADAEQTFKSDVRGFQVEMFYHRSGYRMQGEPMASHSRKRYRLLPTNPNMPNCDPSLFLVAYSRAAPRDIVPAGSIPVSSQTQHQIQQRRMIQAQGQLARKEFMLHDRSNWPTINAPQAVTRGQSGHRRGASHGNEATLEEEEDVSRGDILDFMSPRDISRVRYEQHHEWMEEILESPYGIFSILPGDLGLGRKGELEVLTKDFFDAPVTVLRESSGNSDPLRVGRLENGKADDFNKRATQRIADMQAEIDKLKRQHAARIDRLKRTSVLSTAEKKLRAAPTENEKALSNASSVDHPNGDVLDDIAQEVQSSLGRKIERVSPVTMVERGGLEDRPPPRTLSMSSSSKPQMSPVKMATSPSESQPPPQAPADPQQATSASEVSAVQLQANESAPSNVSVPPPQPQQTVGEPQDTPAMGEDAQDLDLADGVDLDINMDGLDDGPDAGDDLVNADNDWVMDMEGPEGGGEHMEAPTAEEAAKMPDTSASSSANQAPENFANQSNQQGLNRSGQTSNQGTPAEQGQGDQMESNEFSEAFGDVDTAGDALASYDDDGNDELNLDGMDDSAFGDAFHQEDLS